MQPDELPGNDDGLAVDDLGGAGEAVSPPPERKMATKRVARLPSIRLPYYKDAAQAAGWDRSRATRRTSSGDPQGSGVGEMPGATALRVGLRLKELELTDR